MINDLLEKGFSIREIILIFTSFSMSNIREKDNKIVFNNYFTIIKYYYNFEIETTTSKVYCIEETLTYKGTKEKNPLFSSKVIININSFNSFIKGKEIIFNMKLFKEYLSNGQYENIKNSYEFSINQLDFKILNVQ